MITVAEAFISVWARVRLLSKLLTDNGIQFVNSWMAELNRLLLIKHLKTTPYNPKAMGWLNAIMLHWRLACINYATRDHAFGIDTSFTFRVQRDSAHGKTINCYWQMFLKDWERWDGPLDPQNVVLGFRLNFLRHTISRGIIAPDKANLEQLQKC